MSRQVRVIALFTLRESLRRRVFVVVSCSRVAFLGLYALGTWRLFARRSTTSRRRASASSPSVIAGATLLGLAMFATLFLGTVLAVFLTLGAVRGDAERGLLQPLLVRPVSRAHAAARALRRRRRGVRGLRGRASSSPRAVITWVIGGWWPDR